MPCATSFGKGPATPAEAGRGGALSCSSRGGRSPAVRCKPSRSASTPAALSTASAAACRQTCDASASKRAELVRKPVARSIPAASPAPTSAGYCSTIRRSSCDCSVASPSDVAPTAASALSWAQSTRVHTMQMRILH
eukprot:2476632-Prymnesium_polylepis.1